MAADFSDLNEEYDFINIVLLEGAHSNRFSLF